jgi:hypothetical protein
MDGMTRRSALLAAAAVSLSTTELLAEGQAPGEGKKPLLLHIVLPDGQTIDLKAAEVKIDFGMPAKLLVTPNGVLPAADPMTQPGDLELAPTRSAPAFRSTPNEAADPFNSATRSR